MGIVITNSVLQGLRTTLGFQFQAGYEDTPTWLDKVANTFDSKTKTNTYAWVLTQLGLREWIGPRLAWNLSEQAAVVTNKKYEGTIEIDREDIEDDNLGMYTNQLVPALARAAKLHPQKLLVALLQANGVQWDGVTLFNDAHPNGGGGTYDNNFTNNMDGDGVAAVYAAMASITGADGQPLEITPNLLIVPPQLRRQAMTVVASTTYAIPNGNATNGSATVDNVMRGWFDVLVLPELANAPTVWYMADTTKPVKPFFYQSRDTPELVSKDKPEDDNVFELDKYRYGVRMRGAAGATLPFLVAKAVHTP